MATAQQLFAVVSQDRKAVHGDAETSIAAIRLFDLLPGSPVITLPRAIELLKVSKPTAIRALATLCKLGIAVETTGKQRDRVYAYQKYMTLLTQDT